MGFPSHELGQRRLYVYVSSLRHKTVASDHPACRVLSDPVGRLEDAWSSLSSSRAGQEWPIRALSTDRATASFLSRPALDEQQHEPSLDEGRDDATSTST